MISKDLDLMGGNFMNQWGQLSIEDKQKGISATVIANWIQKDNEVISILMPLLGYKKMKLAANTYWFEPSAYNTLLDNIKWRLLS